ncbi:uncharacterized protein PODANS_7_8610 [Podospora anserina S mat+]|uniref:Podospora anserina S mat+ genomic DNA chromosome 7, supercontig 1 n=1 Tax=Podospora anserina (strain S / ATCC MYA-4624 / DSM 980 / FGSC 10383) TaxID=515849 RepID=B2AWX5_PODAN|nr:uncharacterized protein PODANS_7_8610 [Podospora anserina S mat+]CAP68899.1 unnamed protein product [Podospora anserina S mat+]CDP32370.1 Putative protein of unknown function [Podospora anserina S mat+]
MAALPPDTIQVKRKRGIDDAPVDFLRVDRSKRYRIISDEVGWVYQRKQVASEQEKKPKHDASLGVPTIVPTQEGDEKRLNRPKKTPRAPSTNASTTLEPVPALAPARVLAPEASDSSDQTVNLRKFHLSRPNSSQPSAGVTKKRGATAVFVERGPKRQKSAILTPQVVKEILDQPNTTQSSISSSPAKDLPSSSQEAEKKPVVYKRPGTKPRNKTSASESGTTSKPSVPPSMHNRRADMDELSRVMDTWTLGEISKNLDRVEQLNAKSKSSPAKSRFQPKAPKLRYHERHPTENVAQQQRAKDQAAPAAAASTSAMDIDMIDTSDDDDYVIETYERVPAERLRDQAVPAHRIGLLVFDNEPDVADFFYGNDDETDDEFPEDEDDENAENYYAHEYPDEELEWSDEFDHNAYHYAAQNFSENEEWDDRDFADEAWDAGDTVKNF